MGRTWPDKEKKHETPFFLIFSTFFILSTLLKYVNMDRWLNQPIAVVRWNRKIGLTHAQNFRKSFQKIPKINMYGEFTWSVYWNACKTLFLKPWILKIFLEVQIILMNRSHRFRAKKCYFRIAKSRKVEFLVIWNISNILFGVKSENTIWLIIPIS